MQNIKIIESNYPIDNSHYNTFQCKLPLDFFTVVPVDDWYYVKKKCQLNRNFFYLTSTFEKC